MERKPIGAQNKNHDINDCFKVDFFNPIANTWLTTKFMINPKEIVGYALRISKQCHPKILFNTRITPALSRTDPLKTRWVV